MMTASQVDQGTRRCWIQADDAHVVHPDESEKNDGQFPITLLVHVEIWSSDAAMHKTNDGMDEMIKANPNAQQA